MKRRLEILRSLEEADHEYFAFFVCRNPIERLKSLYSYSLDLGRFKKGQKPKNLKDFIMKVFAEKSQFGKYCLPLIALLTAPCRLQPDVLALLPLHQALQRRHQDGDILTRFQVITEIILQNCRGRQPLANWLQTGHIILHHNDNDNINPKDKISSW